MTAGPRPHDDLRTAIHRRGGILALRPLGLSAKDEALLHRLLTEGEPLDLLRRKQLAQHRAGYYRRKAQ